MYVFIGDGDLIYAEGVIEWGVIRFIHVIFHLFILIQFRLNVIDSVLIRENAGQ